MIKTLLSITVLLVSSSSQAMMFGRRYDFEVWNLESEKRICKARGDKGYGERIKNRSFPKGAPGSVFNTFEVL
jgi:hypothetical protein